MIIWPDLSKMIFNLAKTTGVVVSSVILVPAAASADQWKFGAEIAGELRYFPDNALGSEQIDTWQPSITIQPDIRWESENRTHQIVLTPFARLDGQDAERTHVDFREAYYRFSSDFNWSVTIGAAKVFWGRTESRHLVDIINQTDSVEDIDEEDKLGQPMVNFSFINDWGTLDLFFMSGFRDRTFPGIDGRLRFELPIETGDPIFTRTGRRAAPDVAIRYGHYIGNWDFGIAAFHGTSREARFAIANDGGSLRPVYDRISQASIDLQYTKDAWLWKLEALIRDGQGERFFASVAGFEYTLYQIFGSEGDLGLLAEYQYDARDDNLIIETLEGAPTFVTEAPPIASDNDLFLGARFAFNDIQNTSILAGGTIDTQDQSATMFIEAERRLFENWTTALEARLFFNVNNNNIINAFRNDDFINFRITRYF